MKDLNRSVIFTSHARVKMEDRGISEEDIIAALRMGRREPARRGLWQYRLNQEFHRKWANRYYGMRQVAPIVDEEEKRYVVVTVYAFYFQEGQER